ncbi:hypothetical protein ACE6H2_025912 [Prunus campanulata]
MKEKKRAISLKNWGTNGDPAKNHPITAAAPDQSAENGCKIEVYENKKTTMKEKKTTISLKNRGTNGDPARNYGGNAD